jgi:hypothetical protein
VPVLGVRGDSEESPDRDPGRSLEGGKLPEEKLRTRFRLVIEHAGRRFLNDAAYFSPVFRSHK